MMAKIKNLQLLRDVFGLTTAQITIFSRLLFLTDNGSKTCTYSDSQGQKDTGLDKRSVRRNLKALQIKHFIDFSSDNSSGKRTRSVLINPSVLEKIEASKTASGEGDHEDKMSSCHEDNHEDKKPQNHEDIHEDNHEDKMSSGAICNINNIYLYNIDIAKLTKWDRSFCECYRKIYEDASDLSRPYRHHPEIKKAWTQWNAWQHVKNGSKYFIDASFEKLEDDLSNIGEWLEENVTTGIGDILDVKYPGGYDYLADRIVSGFNPHRCKSREALGNFVRAVIRNECSGIITAHWDDLYEDVYIEEAKDWIFYSAIAVREEDKIYHPLRPAMLAVDRQPERFAAGIPLLAFVKERVMEVLSYEPAALMRHFGSADPRVYYRRACELNSCVWEFFCRNYLGGELDALKI